jgi:hypothetical protein
MRKKRRFQRFLFQCNVIIHKMMKANLASYKQTKIVSGRVRPMDRGVTRIRRLPEAAVEGSVKF